MKKVLFLSFFLILPFMVSQAQKRITLGVDAGYKGDLYRLNDPDGFLKNTPAHGGYVSFNLSKEFSKHWLLETGARLMNYQSGIRFKGTPATTVTGSMNTWQIPLSLKYRLYTRNNRFSVTPFAGLAISFNNDYVASFPPDHSYSSSGGSYYYGENKYAFDQTDHFNYKNVFPLFETGVTFDYHTRWGLQLSLGTSWQGGFTKVIQNDVTYSINDGPEHHATYTSHGNNFRVMFGMSYAVSRFWQEKREEAEKEAIREKVSRLSASRFYVGTEIYGIWNRFSHDNPDIFAEGAWEDMGFGIYGGMRVWKPLWLETGFYTERFSNNYMIYENDRFAHGGGFMVGGTGFYRIPLLLRYKYTTAHGRLSLSPYLGASLLISATGTGEYARSNSYGWSDDGVHAIDTIYDNSVAYRLKKSVVTLNAGMGVEYSLFPRFIITLRGDYSLGFTDINHLHVEQTGTLSGTREGNIYYNGSGWRISAGIKIPLGR